MNLMVSFVSLYTGKTTSIFNQETTIQVRATQDKKEVLDSFNMEEQRTEVYTVMFFDEPLSPNYQLPFHTDISNAVEIDEAYCYRCGKRKADAIHCKVWFRSNKPVEKQTICKDCANKLIECKEYGLNQVPHSKIAEKVL